MKILFLLRTGVIEWPVPDGIKEQFSFNAMATRVRVDGYFLSENLYIRHDELVGISFAPDDVPPVVRRDLN